MTIPFYRYQLFTLIDAYRIELEKEYKNFYVSKDFIYQTFKTEYKQNLSKNNFYNFYYNYINHSTGRLLSRKDKNYITSCQVRKQKLDKSLLIDYPTSRNLTYIQF